MLKITSITDDFLKISLIISRRIITASCSLAKPSRASLGVKFPAITKANMAIKKVTVGLNHSRYNAVNKNTMIASIAMIEGVSIINNLS